MLVVDNRCIARVIAKWNIEATTYCPDLFDAVKDAWKEIAVNLVSELFPQRRRYEMEWRDSHFSSPNLLLQVRPPVIPPSLTPGQHWHDDGISYKYTLLWTNREPVLIRRKETDLPRFSPESNEIVIIDNDLAEHRTPVITTIDRWIALALITRED